MKKTNPTNQDKPGPKLVYGHSNFANTFCTGRVLGGVSKIGRDEMNGILQESQFNAVGTIKVKTRLHAGLGSDGESPSIVGDL